MGQDVANSIFRPPASNRETKDFVTCNNCGYVEERVAYGKSMVCPSCGLTERNVLMTKEKIETPKRRNVETATTPFVASPLERLALLAEDLAGCKDASIVSNIKAAHHLLELEMTANSNKE